MNNDKGCELVMCMDPVTGRVTAKPRGKCPEGFIERIRDAVDERGLVFIKPKTSVEEE